MKTAEVDVGNTITTYYSISYSRFMRKFLNTAVTELILTWVLLDWLVEPFQIHQCFSLGVFSKGNTTKPFVLSGQYN